MNKCIYIICIFKKIMYCLIKFSISSHNLLNETVTYYPANRVLLCSFSFSFFFDLVYLDAKIIMLAMFSKGIIPPPPKKKILNMLLSPCG